MKKFDREALSDHFDSISLANEIRRQFELKDEAAPLYKIAHAVGVWNIKEESLSSIEGALVVPDGKFEGEIILNSNQIDVRKRFTLAHEIGHFVHPLHQPDAGGRFNCSNDDIFKTYQRGQIAQIEDEANEFASELLVPKNNLSALVNRGHLLDFQEIIDFCDRLEVSKAFAIRKLQPLCKTPTAFIFSLNGVCRYSHSDNFPFLKIWSKDNLPTGCVSTMDLPDNTVGNKVQLASDVWLKRPLNKGLYEQVFVQENGYRVTMLIIN